MFSNLGPFVQQYIIVFTVSLSGLTTGLGLGWPSPVLVKLRNVNETVLSSPLTEEDGSWIVSIGFLTGILGNIIAACLIDTIGRKYTIILACLPRIFIGFVFIFATEVWMLMIGRGILGITEGLVFAVLPIYTSEMASKEIRGSLGIIIQIMSAVGLVTMLCVGPFTPYVPLNIFYTATMVLTTLPLFFLPDSPYFLYYNGRSQEALELLTSLRSSEDQAIQELKEYNTNPKNEKVNRSEHFKNKTFLKSFMIVMVLCVATILSGFNMITFYLQTILESTGTSIMSEVESVIIGLIQIIASISAIFVTDRFGRKPLLTTTLTGMALGMVGLGTFFFIKDNEISEISGFMNFLPLFSLILIVYCYSAGIGTVNSVLSAELFDDPARGVGIPITSLISMLVMFLATKYFPMVIIAIGPAATYWIFSVVCVSFCLFILFCVPETKGKTITEIQTALGAKEKVRELSKV